MSHKGHNTGSVRLRDRASLFAALGDTTRLTLVAKLSDGRRHSIAELTEGSRLTRQAITKHLRVLHAAGMVRCTRTGRESRLELKTQPQDKAKDYIDLFYEQLDQALSRLKSFVER